MNTTKLVAVCIAASIVALLYLVSADFFTRTPESHAGQSVPNMGTEEPTVPVSPVDTQNARGHTEVRAGREATAETAARREVVPHELSAVSESFRNSTLLIAIQDAGFVCEDVVRAVQLGDGAGSWRVECAHLFAYSVSSTDAGGLLVAPTPHSFDGVVPLPLLPDRRRTQ